MNKTDLAYMAGYVDADGSITLVRRKGARNGRIFYTVRVMVSGTKREAMDWMKDKFGGCVGLHSRGTEKWKPVYSIQIQSKMALKVLQQIQPFLIVKRRQCELALEFGAYAARHRAHKGKPLPPDYDEVVDRTVKKMRHHNVRGPHARKEG